ncbi:uncharacterized protein BJX67DRAFT_360911 [Aspergillus lucknowensis]|uniref:Uncharacterized protein n=1 Tax=Aspergillus lucknowensis TaxID=176173 RepID=A0ABR4LMD7_9EURO
MSLFGSQPAGQLEGYAFTVAGAAYQLDPVFKDRSKPWYVTALSPSSISVEDGLRANPYEGMSHYPEHEKEDPVKALNQTKYVVLGVFPAQDLSDKDYAAKRVRGHAVGYELPDKILQPRDDGSLPLRVVTPVVSDPKVGVKLYVLTNVDRVSGLCYSYTIAQQKVFYFSEYRNAQVNQRNRQTEWNALAARFAKDSAHRQFMDRRHGKSLVVSIETDLINKLKLLSAGIKTIEQRKYQLLCSDILKTITRLEVDDSPAEVTVERFFDGNFTMDFGHQDAVALVAELQQFWIGVPGLSPTLLIKVRDALVSSRLCVELRYAREFIVHTLSRFEDFPNQNPVDTVTRVYNVIKAAGIARDARTSSTLFASRNEQIAALAADIEWLESLKDTVIAQSDRISAFYGRQASPAFIEEVYAQLPNALTKDERRLVYDQGLAFVCSQAEKDTLALVKHIDEYLQLKKSIGKELLAGQES